jgi:hypothetical protein
MRLSIPECRTVAKLFGRPVHSIQKSIAKHLDKSGFDEIIQIRYLRFFFVNNILNFFEFFARVFLLFDARK